VALHIGNDVTVGLPDPDRHFASICDGVHVICENANSAARWRPRPEITSPFDSPTRFPISGSLTVFVYLHPFKSYQDNLGIFVKIAPPDLSFDIFQVCVILCLSSCISRVCMNRLCHSKVMQRSILAGKLTLRVFFNSNSRKTSKLDRGLYSRIPFAKLHRFSYGRLKSVESF
jgi:hypothetical protein